MTAPDGSIRSALRYPAFRSLLAGLAVSQVGDWLYNLALVTLVYQRTGSALWAGVATAARIVPMVVLGPVGGAIADRFDRRRVMVGCDLLRLALMLALAAAAAARLPIVVIPVLAALATAAGTPYLPATSATTPRLVRDADLPGANAARSGVSALGIIVGPALGGVLLLLGSPALAFAVNALTFALAAVCVLSIRTSSAFAVTSAAGPRGGNPLTGVLRGMADGAAALRAHPAAVRLVGADIMCSLIYGTQTVLLILVARSAGLGLHGYGYLFAGIGAGGVLATALAGRVARLPYRTALVGALALVGLPTLALPAAHWGPAAIVLAGLTGAGAIGVEIMTETGLQRMLPEDVFGRAYGLALPASIAGIVAGSLIAPVLVSLLGVTGALLACGAAVMGYAALLLRGTDSPAPAPALDKVLVG